MSSRTTRPTRRVAARSTTRWFPRAGPRASAIGERRDVQTVDEDLDLVVDSTDGGLLLGHPVEALVGVAGVGEHVSAARVRSARTSGSRPSAYQVSSVRR